MLFPLSYNFSTKEARLNLLFTSLLFFTFFTAPIFSYSPLRFSDLGAIMIIIISLKTSIRIKMNSFNIALLLVGIWAIFQPVFLIWNEYFILSNHIFQLTRLLLGISVCMCVRNILYDIDLYDISLLMVKLIRVHLFFLFLYVLLYYLGFDFIFNITNSFEERSDLIANNHLFFNHFIIIHNFSGLRFCGLFEEPAWMGWVFILILGFIFEAEIILQKKILKRCDYIMLLVSILFTVSFSFAGSFIILILFRYIRKRGAKFKILFFSISLICLSILLSYINMVGEGTRIYNIVNGYDGSSSSRLIGSLNSILSSLNSNPFTGCGLGDGNYVNYVEYLQSTNKLVGVWIGNLFLIENHNIVGQFITSTGLIGFFIFLYIIVKIWKKTSIFYLSLFIVCFTVNVFNTYLFFCMLSLSYFYLCHEKKVY